MNFIKEAQAPFPEIGEESWAAVQQAVREALIERHKAGQKVSAWRDGKVVCVGAKENGDDAE